MTTRLDICRGIVALSQKRTLTEREAKELSKALNRLEKTEGRKKPGRLQRPLRWAR